MFALMRFDVIASLGHNPIVFYIALCILLVNIFGIIAIIKKKAKVFLPWRPLIYGGAVILTLFFIIKNALMIFFKIDLSNELITYWM